MALRHSITIYIPRVNGLSTDPRVWDVALVKIPIILLTSSMVKWVKFEEANGTIWGRYNVTIITTFTGNGLFGFWFFVLSLLLDSKFV